MSEPKVRLLSTPNISDIGANIELMAIYNKEFEDGPTIRLAHIYAELIVAATDMKDVDATSASIMTEQLATGTYHTTEWVEIELDGKKECMLAVINQVPERLHPAELTYVKDLLHNFDKHGWAIKEDGTAFNMLTGQSYTVDQQNEFTLALRDVINNEFSTTAIDVGVFQLATLLACPFFKEVYVERVKEQVADEVNMSEVESLAAKFEKRTLDVLSTH